MRRTTILLCASVLLASCGGAQHEHEHLERDQDLGENHAIEIIAQTLDQNGVAAQAGWMVDVGGTSPLEVDVRLANGNYGIEYVTAQDRIDYGAAFPAVPEDRLTVIGGHGDSSQAQILLLDERHYTYDPHLEHVQAGESSAADAEGRLGRDVRDFLENVRGQGGP